VVTSETGTLVAVRPDAMALSIRMDDDNEICRLEGAEIGADRLALGYAVTVHRSQGSTVERAHALEDGGGRELAYVKMSRAKQRSTVYVVADSLGQAKEDLCREWGADRRLGWVIDTATPMTDPLSAELSATVAQSLRDALRRGRLVAERAAILAVVPPDPSAHIRAAELQRSRLQRDREDLAAGKGPYRDHPVAHVIRELHHAEVNIARLERNLAGPAPPGPTARCGAPSWPNGDRPTPRPPERLQTSAHPSSPYIDDEERRLGEHLAGLWEQRETHQRWAADHPEAWRRLDHLAADIETLDARLDHSRLAHDRARIVETRGVVLDRGLDIDL
jgi:hypothetical protein